MTRTGTCKDTSHPEKNYCILRCFSPCTSKTGMSITIMLSISELLLMYLFWGIFETSDINLCETLHREILLPGSGGKKQERHTTMCCSRNLVLMSSKFALRLTPALVSCLRSLPSASEYTLPSQSASSLQKHSQVTALVQSPQAWKLQHMPDTEVLFLSLLLGRSLFKRSCRLGQSLTGKKNTKQ